MFSQSISYYDSFSWVIPMCWSVQRITQATQYDLFLTVSPNGITFSWLCCILQHRASVVFKTWRHVWSVGHIAIFFISYLCIKVQSWNNDNRYICFKHSTIQQNTWSYVCKCTDSFWWHDGASNQWISGVILNCLHRTCRAKCLFLIHDFTATINYDLCPFRCK